MLSVLNPSISEIRHLILLHKVFNNTHAKIILSGFRQEERKEKESGEKEGRKAERRIKVGAVWIK